MKKLYDVVVPLITPLTERDEIDVPSLERLTDYLIENHMDCLYPCGTTGEMAYLTQEERKLVVETVVRRAAHRVPVFAQVGASNTAQTIELAKHAYDCGADGIGVVTPWYFQLSAEALIAFYEEVAASVPEDYPVYLYGIPQNAVNDITPAIAEELAARCPNIVGIKYSYPDMTKLQSFMTIRGGDFDVLVGPDHLYEAVMAVGGRGVVSGNAMIIPTYYNAVKEAMKAGDWKTATLMQRKTNVLNGILCANNNISCYKEVLKQLGIIDCAKMRKPMVEIGQAYREELLQKLQQLQYQSASL